MRIRVNVTAEDIESGQRRCGTDCPVFHALSRALSAIPGYPTVRQVSNSRIEFSNDGRIALPWQASNFIDVFDQEGRSAVTPFSFDLEVPIP